MASDRPFVYNSMMVKRRLFPIKRKVEPPKVINTDLDRYQDDNYKYHQLNTQEMHSQILNEVPKYGRKNKKYHSGEYYQIKYGKPLADMIENDRLTCQLNNKTSYLDIGVGKSYFPKVNNCRICGHSGKYFCTICNQGVCSQPCFQTHQTFGCHAFQKICYQSNANEM